MLKRKCPSAWQLQPGADLIHFRLLMTLLKLLFFGAAMQHSCHLQQQQLQLPSERAKFSLELLSATPMRCDVMDFNGITVLYGADCSGNASGNGNANRG